MHGLSISKFMVHWKVYSIAWSEEPLLRVSCSCVPWLALGTTSLGIKDVEVSRKKLYVDTKFTLQCKNPSATNHTQQVVYLSLCFLTGHCVSWLPQHPWCVESLGKDWGEDLFYVLLFQSIFLTSLCLLCDNLPVSWKSSQSHRLLLIYLRQN